MKVSITTPTCNSEATIEDTVVSIISQTYSDLEHIIKDCGSTDRTVAILKSYPQRITKIIASPDEGIYDAINQGIEVAEGDIIGNLNSDDIYADNTVIEEVVACFEKYQVDCCWGDLVYVAKDNPQKTVRYWRSSDYRKDLFETGWVPPHPTFFVKRELLKRYGLYKADFKIAADYELMFRFLRRFGLRGKYIPKTLVKMRVGGVAHQWQGIAQGQREWMKAWKQNNLKMPFYAPALRLARRIPQLLVR